MGEGRGLGCYFGGQEALGDNVCGEEGDAGGLEGGGWFFVAAAEEELGAAGGGDVPVGGDAVVVAVAAVAREDAGLRYAGHWGGVGRVVL